MPTEESILDCRQISKAFHSTVESRITGTQNSGKLPNFLEISPLANNETRLYKNEGKITKKTRKTCVIRTMPE